MNTILKEGDPYWHAPQPTPHTLRQQYAMAAMQALIQSRGGSMPDHEIVSESFWFADAMLAHEAREGKED